MSISVGSDLIEQQIRRWELAQKEKTRGPRPCLALSRLPGTPAVEIGQRVAERLGYGFFGIELVDEIARTEGVNRYLVEGLDEHVRTGLDRWLLDTFRNPTWGEKEYFHGVGRTLHALGDKGSAVIIGRGAPFVITSDKALRVQVIGSEPARVARTAKAKGLDPGAARAALAAEEAERLRFLREFVADPDDAAHFDLIVNSDHRSVDYWVEVVVHAVETLP